MKERITLCALLIINKRSTSSRCHLKCLIAMPGVSVVLDYYRWQVTFIWGLGGHRCSKPTTNSHSTC